MCEGLGYKSDWNESDGVKLNGENDCLSDITALMRRWVRGVPFEGGAGRLLHPAGGRDGKSCQIRKRSKTSLFIGKGEIRLLSASCLLSSILEKLLKGGVWGYSVWLPRQSWSLSGSTGG